MSDQPEHHWSCSDDECADVCPRRPMHEDHNCGPACPVPCPLDDDDPRGWEG